MDDPRAPAAGTSASRIAQALRSNVPALDGLRGIAIALVMAHNLSVLDDSPGLSARVIGRFVDAGWIGVQLFFALSGFLITSILLATKEAPNYFRAFFGRRVVRIFPLYYGVLIVAFVVLPILHAAPQAITSGAHNQVWLWTYLSNWASPFGRGVDAFPHFWSLAVEEQFYLLWPLLVHSLSTRGLIKTCVALAVVAFVSRLALLLSGFDVQGPYLFTICRMDALALGAAGAALLRIPAAVEWIVTRRRMLARIAMIGLAVGFVVTGDYARTKFDDQTFGYTLLAVVFATLVTLSVVSDALGAEDGARQVWWVRALHNRVLRELGRVSYGLYVFHMLLHLFVGMPLFHRWHPAGDNYPLWVSLLYMTLTSLGTYLVALASYYGFELPFLRLKRFFVAERPRAGATT